MPKNDYTTSNIKVLDDITAVRLRIGMYLGHGIDAQYQAFQEIFSNSVDEHLQGYGDKIRVILLSGGFVQVEDSGRGIPFGLHESGKDTLEVIFSVLHAGGKFDNESYKKSGGSNGVGSSAVNFISTEFIARSTRNNKRAFIKFKDGIKESFKVSDLDEKTDSGTIIRYRLSEGVIPEMEEYNIERIINICKIASILNSNLTVEVVDARTTPNKGVTLDYPSISYFLKEMSDSEMIIDPIEGSYKSEDIDVDFGLMYTKTSFNKVIQSYVNNIPTYDGGTHERGFITGVVEAINEMLVKKKFIDKNTIYSEREVTEGLIGLVSVNMLNPKFTGQTKNRLANSEARDFVADVIKNEMIKFLKKDEDLLFHINERVQTNRKANLAAERARNTVIKGNSLLSTGLVGKLADCEKGAKYSELYIAEGDSAGGIIRQARTRKFQAVLPLKGKILNTEGYDIDKMLDSKEIKNMVDAIGCGILPRCNPSSSRYDKIVIATDSDDDG